VSVRILSRSVLIFEAIMMGLFIPVAYFTGRGLSGATAAWLGAGLVVLCIVAAGAVGRPGGVALGWVVQALVIASGLLVWDMFILGVLFALLWWAALYYGAKVDATKSANSGGSGSPDDRQG